jgi:hypothetical protein
LLACSRYIWYTTYRIWCTFLLGRFFG